MNRVPGLWKLLPKFCIICQIQVDNPDPVNENCVPGLWKSLSHFYIIYQIQVDNSDPVNENSVPGWWNLFPNFCFNMPDPGRQPGSSTWDLLSRSLVIVSTIFKIQVDNPDPVNETVFPVFGNCFPNFRIICQFWVRQLRSSKYEQCSQSGHCSPNFCKICWNQEHYLDHVNENRVSVSKNCSPTFGINDGSV